jgi:hypothetical protein
MKRYDVVVPRKDPRDPNKTYWGQVGSLVKFEATPDKPEGFILELHMFPDTTFKVFERKPKAPDAAQAEKDANAAWDAVMPGSAAVATPVDISADDIPF